jgi:hypothetical protein
MWERGVEYIATKRRKMIKNEELASGKRNNIGAKS